MKWMKWFLVLAVGVGVAVATVGCDDDDDDQGSNNSLVGTWKATHYDGQPIPAGTVALTMTFRSDGSFNATTVLGGAAENVNGTWSAANGILTTTTPDGTDRISYSVSGNTLTLSDPEGAFTLKRQ